MGPGFARDRLPALLRGAALAPVVALICAYALLVQRTAWLSDDAFISLRTVANVLGGYGLRWNVDERVQTFTHPLWLAFLTGAHAISGEPFYSTLYLSWAISVCAVGVLLLRARGGFAAQALVVGLLCSSKAFVDYSSSGLENPLTHALLAVFATEYLKPEPGRVRPSVLAAAAGLALLNRLDTGLLFLPALLPVLLRADRAQRIRGLCLLLAPLLIWEIFSLTYYGFPFPNTAYAKLNVGEIAGPDSQLAMRNFRSSFSHDPITLSTIALCCALALSTRDAARQWLLSGALLYCGYVIWIGGDFLQGRFFSAPFFLAAACLCTHRGLAQPRPWLAAAALALALSAMGDAPPFLTTRDFGSEPGLSIADENGIHEERRAFFQVASLTNARRMNPARDDHPWSRSGHSLRALVARDPSQRVQLIGAIGFAGYYAGPAVHLIDHWALADPLLARLPALFGGIGHFHRVPPAGYVASLQSGANQLADPSLKAYYSALREVTRGPLFSWRRWRAIAQLNLGSLDRLVRAHAYVSGTRIRIQLAVINPTAYPQVGTYVWNDNATAHYVIDSKSTRGRQYALSWIVSAKGAHLESPEGVQIRTLDHLAPSGVFTVSLGLHEQLAGPVNAIYEYRYFYRLKGDRVLLLRDPWPVSVTDLPNLPWRTDLAAVAPALGQATATAID